MDTCRTLCLLSAFAWSACSVLTPIETCESDSDCAALQYCAPERFCLDLVGSESPCGEIIGSQAADALRLGFIMTLSGPDRDKGVDRAKAVKLAADEINAKGGIQRAGHDPQPLSFIACDDAADEATTLAAVSYLQERGVPAILGPGRSGLLKSAATELAIPGGTFLLSPSSTAGEIRDLCADKLVWRVSSSDTQQANTLAYFAVAKALELEVPDKAINLVTVHTEDLYGTGFRDGFESALTGNMNAFKDPIRAAELSITREALAYNSEAENDDWAQELQGIVSALEAKEPDILLLVGYEGTADIVGAIKEVDTLNDLPIFLTDGTLSNTLATTYGAESELPNDVFGVQPGFRTGPSYSHFFEIFGEPVLPVWTEHTYDAAYLLAYAAAAVPPDQMSGLAFAEAFRRFDDPQGRKVDVGPDHFITACERMDEGLTLDVRGASGYLDFGDESCEPETVGILRWQIGFPTPNDLGEIVNCGLAMVHDPGNLPTTYWCNAQCLEPPEDNLTCEDGFCEDESAICAHGRCTSGDDCQPAHVP